MSPIFTTSAPGRKLTGIQTPSFLIWRPSTSLSDHSLIEFGISNIVYQAEINANGFYLTTYTLMNIYCSLTNQKQMVDNSQQMTYPNYTLQRTVKAMNGVD